MPSAVIHVSRTALEYNLVKVNEVIESSFSNLSISERYQLKLKRMKLILALTELFDKEHIDAYFDILTQQVIDAVDYEKQEEIKKR